MRIAAADRNVVVLTASRHELTTIVAAARMALEVLDADVNAPAEARARLTRALRDYDAAIARATPTKTGSTPVGPAQGDVRCT
jgi:hypothetical protein